VVGHELGQIGIGFVDRRYPPQPQLRNEPRLKGPPKPFYPALRLGDRGGYQLDPELLAHAFEVDVHVAVYRLVLLGKPPELEYRPVVPVEGLRDPVFVQDLPHHLVVTLKGFLLLEAEAHHGSGGVVYGPVEGGFGKRIAEPVMDGGVDLEQLPEALPPGPRRMLGLLLPRLMAFGRSEPGGGQDPVDIPVRGPYSFVFVQLLKKMLEVEAGVLAAIKLDYPPFRLGVRLPFRRLPAVAVPEGGGPLFGIGLLEPVHVLLADPEFGRGLARLQLPRNRLSDDRFDVGIV